MSSLVFDVMLWCGMEEMWNYYFGWLYPLTCFGFFIDVFEENFGTEISLISGKNFRY